MNIGLTDTQIRVCADLASADIEEPCLVVMPALDRGGGWIIMAEYCRVAMRLAMELDHWYDDYEFRVVLDLR